MTKKTTSKYYRIEKEMLFKVITDKMANAYFLQFASERDDMSDDESKMLQMMSDVISHTLLGVLEQLGKLKDYQEHVAKTTLD